MPKTQSPGNSLTGKQEPPQPEEDANFKIGSHALIKSTHPLFPSFSCTITAFPSSDAVIVELSDGARQRLLLEHLEPSPMQTQEVNTSLSDQQSISDDTLSNSSLPSQNSYSCNSRFEVIEPLTPDEERERHRLELKVERAFYEAGCALRDLRDKRLYRSTHGTFEQYCKDRFGFARRHPYRLIDAVAVVDNLCPNRTQDDAQQVCPIRTQILPTNLEQVRHMTSLQPEEQRAAWQQAIDLADGKVPTGKIVKGIVLRMKEKPLYLASDYCLPCEVFFLTRLCGEERKYNGRWAVAIEVENRFTVKAASFRVGLEVRQENIQRIDCEQTQAEIRDIHQRLTKLMKYELDPIDEAQIEILCRRAWFTQRQKEALTTLERVYEAG